FGFLRTGQERMLSNPYLVFVHQPGRGVPAWTGSSLLFQACFAAVSAGLLMGLAALFQIVGAPVGLPPVLVVLALGIPFLLLRDHLRAISAAHEKFGTALLIDLGVSAIQLGGLVALNAFAEVTIPRVAALLGFACLVPAGLWWLVTWPRLELDWDQVGQDWLESWHYSRWLVLARTLGIGGYFAVPWLVVFFLGESEAGIFATCSAVVGLSLMFLNGANNFFQPRTVKANQDRGVSGMGRVIVTALLVIGSFLTAVSTLLFFAGGTVMQMFGPAYTDYGDLAFWLSLSMLAVSVSIVCGNGFAALRCPQGYFWGELSYSLVAVGLSIVLIPWLGLNGAALALVAAGLAASVVTSCTLIPLIREAWRREATEGRP
ncbi:MAG: hypothetical protein AAGF97_16925, partial [Planctomycetota bacterium]